MINGLSIWIEILFLIAFCATIVFFYYSNAKPKLLTGVIILWSIVQGFLAYWGFYQNTDGFPPRLIFAIIPTTLLMLYGLLPKSQSWFLRNRNTKISTFLHTVRLPVELVLFGLFTQKMVPELMTFGGRNYDILMGITAPVIGLLFIKNIIGKRGLRIWNLIGLVLVLFILVNGILSVEHPFQKFGFEQPNRGILYFPFILLPAVIVPIVIWTHLSDLIKLSKELRKKNQ